MTNDNLDRSIRAIVGDARPTPEAEAAMDDAFAAIAQDGNYQQWYILPVGR